MANTDTFGTILAEIGKGLLPLRDAVSSPQSFVFFMQKQGWQVTAIPQPLEDLGTGIDQLFSELRKIVGNGLAFDGSVSLGTDTATVNIGLDDITAMGHAVVQVVDGIAALASAPDAAFPPSLLSDNFKAKFPKQLVDFLIINYLTKFQPRWAFGLRALGVIKTQYTAPAGNRLPYVNYSLDFSDLPKVFDNPSSILQNAFAWGTNDFEFSAFASQVDNLLWHLGVDTSMDVIPSLVAAPIEGNVTIEGDPQRKALRAVFFERARTSGRMEADVRLLSLPADTGKLPGFAIMPAFNGVLDLSMQLSPDLTLTINSDMDLQGGVGLIVRPGSGIDMVLGFNNGAATHATGSLTVEIDRSQVDNAPVLLLGSPTSTRLQYRKLGGLVGIRLDASQSPDVFAEADLKGLEFVLDSSGADGFIQTIFPPSSAGMGFDLTVGLSHQDGFYFRGTSHLEISVPAHIQLGPIEVQSLTIGANPNGGQIPISLGATFTADLGPLAATVQNIGLTATFSFPDHGGNLGPLDLSLGFKPPDGVGLSVDAGVVQGGGFLSIDTAHGEYAGALQLVFADFLGLQAIGLITTKMPDGSSGFSLLIIITVDFGAGIQLGFGFTLLAVGGLLGLNRSMLFQPLMDGIRNDAIESIMFPQNVVANATRIISDLRGIFPPQQGIFLIGPMAKLGWGEPTLIFLALGVIIEIPPGDIAILGVLKLSLPADDIGVLVLQVNFAGALEFDKQRIYFFASLYDSHVLFITLEGEMGLLMAYGDDANFVVTIGGFHPQFNPPPLPFPSPKRIEVDIINESFARIRCSGYFAVTTNTVQFGSASDFYFGFSALNLSGSSSFDALIQFSPFHFSVDISTSFSVNVFGVGCYGIDMSLTVEGPTPWHVHGTASISFLFFSIGIGVDFTFGDSRNTMLPPIAVMPVLSAEFGKQSNWKAVLPAGSNLLVALRKLDPAESAMVLHPVGTLQVSQRAVPLDMTLDKDGNQQPSDANFFTLDVTSGALSKRQTLQESFAPAQFKNMDDASKLSQPAFVPMDSGIELAAAGNAYASGTAITRNVRYDLTIIDINFQRVFRRFFVYTGSLFAHFLKGSSASRSAFSAARAGQTQPYSDHVTVNAETFAVALQSNNKVYTAQAGAFSSQAAAQDFLNQATAKDPSLSGTLHVLPQFEVAA
jgi:hypothetical protein